NVRFFDDVLRGIGQLPGVESANAAMCAPLSGPTWTSPYQAASQAELPMNERPWTTLNMVTPGYFETMQIPLLEGRVFTRDDGVRSGNVAIINRTMARRLWPNERASGKRVRVTYAEGELLEVVGVVEDVNQSSLDSAVMPEVYVPL